MAAPIDKMTLFEAIKVVEGDHSIRIRREHETEPLKWYRRALALWYYQEDNGALSVVVNDQYTVADFSQPYWTTLAPEEPPQPPQPPQPPVNPNDPGGDGGGGDDGGGGGGDGPEPPVLPPDPDGDGGGGGGSDPPPDPPGDPGTDDPPTPPKPPKQTIEVLDAGVSCLSGPSIEFHITAVASPAGAAYSVVFICGLGHHHEMGVIVGSDNFGPQTLAGESSPHVCCGGTFKISSLTQGGGGPVTNWPVTP